VTTRTLNLALAAALSLGGIAHAADSNPDRTLVEVNGKPVNEAQFLVYRSQRSHGKQLDQQAQLRLLNELVNTVMIAQAAEAEGLDKHPELVAAVDVARYRILAEAAVQNYLRSHPVSDADVTAAYKARYGKGGVTEYKARHILLKTEDDAKAVIAELDKGGDFAALAKAKSTGPSGASGGELGWFEQNSMVPAFAEAVAAMKKGQHSAKPVKTQFGWHVIELEDTRQQPAPKLDDVRKSLTEQLQRKKVAGYVEQIRAKAKVKAIGQEKSGAKAGK